MKIAHLVCTYPPYKGGMGNSTRYFRDYQAKAGLEARVFTPRYPGLAGTEPGAEYLRPLFCLGNGAILPQIWWRLRPFDIIHFHYPFFGSFGLLGLYLLTRPKRQKLVIHYHMAVSFRSPFTRFLSLPETWIRPWVFARADRIIVSSQDYCQNGPEARVFAGLENKITELPFGVEADRFQIAQGGNSPVRLLFVGGLDQAHYFKGLKLLAQALAGIRNYDFTLDIVGSGDLLEYYRQVMVQAGISRKVNFCGNLSDAELRDKYAVADIFVLPSINSNEAFGLVLLEAMAAGLPVVASRLPGVRTVFADQRDGLYFEPGNIKDLQDRLITLLSDPEKRKQMGQSSRQTVLARYDWTEITRKLLFIYESL